jgi:hypothetical protein
MKMTYRKLKEQLDKLNEEQLDSDVSIHDGHADEFYEAEGILETVPEGEDDILDVGHPYIVIRNLG